MITIEPPRSPALLPALIERAKTRQRAGGTCGGCSARRGFSLIEALIALSITSLAGAVLLLSVESSLQTTSDAVERTIADGVAQRLLDEILTRRFVDREETSGSGGSSLLGLEALKELLGPTTSESLGDGFELFDDVDDFAGHSAKPLKGSDGEVLGTGDDNGNQRLENFRLRTSFFNNWRQRVDVYYVTADDHTVRSGTVTPYRAIEVFVERVEADGTAFPLAHRKRIVSYIRPPDA
jgi:prepilin-type N-terminal cleavage/methylation domain-containing protein